MAQLLKFSPFTTIVPVDFWSELAARKIDVEKLDSQSHPVQGIYKPASNVNGDCVFELESKSVTKSKGPVVLIHCQGSTQNVNTIEEFKNADKSELLATRAKEIWECMLDGSIFKDNLHYLTSFYLFTFADLKKFKYFYWFAFPSFLQPTWEILSAKETEGPCVEAIQAWINSENPNRTAFFLIKSSHKGHLVRDISSVQSCLDRPITVGFMDASKGPTPSWPLRNLLCALWAQGVMECQIVRFRLEGQSETMKLSASSSRTSDEMPAATGWQRNPSGKLAPQMIDLAPVMDPHHLASAAVDLNLKLMKWRLVPDLELDRIKNTRVLLLGAGTLGCYVARALLAWGVRNIDFVDNSTVSYSNPVRQPLFTFEDSVGSSTPKAATAAANLKRVFGGVSSTGYAIEVPMIGHPFDTTELQRKERDYEKLETLVESHDVIFLLMDSRESRWLPSCMGAAMGKTVITTALGFDSFVVMRHGHKDQTPRLGCYFCNDVVAPIDSTTDRSLDQMCTVTRPGLAPISSGFAVELFASILQNEQGAAAPAPVPNGPGTAQSSLGTIPHQIRGFLSQFTTHNIVGQSYDRCSACSEQVQAAWSNGRFDFVAKAVNDPNYIPELSGLAELQRQSKDINIDWDDTGSIEYDDGFEPVAD